MLSIEKSLGFPLMPVIGVDEVGRGCLAGPVYAAAVQLPDEVCFKTFPWLKEITDSKKLSPEVRLRLSACLYGWAKKVAVSRCEVAEIDLLNIRQASLKAMGKAVSTLIKTIEGPVCVLIDGKDALSFDAKLLKKIHVMQTVIKGDMKCLSIAAASIIAKVARDQSMVELNQTVPGYAFDQHKGYPTVLHYKRLKEYGISSVHRKVFLRKFLMRG